MSNRDVIVKRLVMSINQVNRWVDVVFPELRQVFKDVTCKGAISTLRLFTTPDEISSLETIDVMRGWKSLMKRQPEQFDFSTDIFQPIQAVYVKTLLKTAGDQVPILREIELPYRHEELEII